MSCLVKMPAKPPCQLDYRGSSLVFGLLIILSYHWSPGFSHLLGNLGSLKSGVTYIPVFQLVFRRVGALPLSFFSRNGSGRNEASSCLFFILYWGFKGMEVDAFYRLQGYLFGYEATFVTILTKVL